MSGTKSEAESVAGEPGEKPKKSIFGTAVTLDYVERRLTEALKTSAKFGNDLKISRLGVGQGFLSVIARICPDWTSDDPNLPQSFIVKIPTVATSMEVVDDERIAETFKDAIGTPNDFILKLQSIVHRAQKAEVTFYEFAQKHGFTAQVPKIYFCEDFSDTCKQGLILMEDMKDATTFTVYDNLTPKEVKRALSALAVIHSFTWEHPEAMDIGHITYVDIMNNYDKVQTFLGNLKLIQTLDEEKLAPLFGEIEKHVEILTDATIFTTLHEQMGLPPQMIHGDFWTANVLFTNVDGEKQVSAVIDWQLVHKGCAAEDISKFVLSSMSPKDRREHLDDLLHHYYDELERNLRKTPPFTFDQLKTTYNRFQPVMMAIMLPICGPFIQFQIQDFHPDRKEKLMEIIRQRAIGYAEDILYYLKLNGNV